MRAGPSYIKIAVFALSWAFILFSCTQSEAPEAVSSQVLQPKIGASAAIPATAFNNAFTQFGPGWTGGDGCYSILLPDGRTVWTFGDTFLGTVNPDRSRPVGVPFINNTMAFDVDGSFTTLHGGTASSPTSFFTTGIPDYFYWPGDGFVHGGKLYVFLFTIHKFGPSAWDFEFVRTDLAVLSLPDLEIQNINTFNPNAGIMWGAAVIEQDDYIYVYGSEDRPSGKHVHVCRIDVLNPTAQPQVFTGTGWSTDESQSKRLLDGNSNQFSVFQHSDSSFHLLTQGDFFSDKVFMYDSPGPAGPFTNKRVLFRTPSRPSNWTYNALVHPQFTSPDGSIVVSWCVNSSDFGSLFSNADNYRPYFAKVTGWE